MDLVCGCREVHLSSRFRNVAKVVVRLFEWKNARMEIGMEIHTHRPLYLRRCLIACRDKLRGSWSHGSGGIHGAVRRCWRQRAQSERQNGGQQGTSRGFACGEGGCCSIWNKGKFPVSEEPCWVNVFFNVRCDTQHPFETTILTVFSGL